MPQLIRTGKLLGAGDMFLQMNTVILSPNVAFSFLILLVALIILHDGNLKPKHYMVLGVCLFLEMGMKFYGGLTLFFLLNLYNVLFLLKKDTI